MTYHKVKLVPGAYHGKGKPGDVITINDAEMKAFGDKFIDLGKADASPDSSPQAIDATASAQKLAEENGIDLADVEGTGKDGRIQKPDVEAYLDEHGGSE